MLEALKNVSVIKKKENKFNDFSSVNFQKSLETIRNDLKNSKAELVIDAMLKEEARQKIKDIIK
ncbi:hypothetical protein GH854_34705, partial [Bacillus thuringiensis]|nr:hypothetical protein [Bacillus thuringiensis]